MQNITKKSLFAAIALLLCCFGSLFAQNQLQTDTLNTEQKNIIAIAALTAKGDLVHLKEALQKGLDAGMTIHKIKECLIHTYAYCGFPRSIRGLQTFIEVLNDRKSKGVQDEMGADSSPIRQRGSKYERGKKILDELTKAPPDRPLAGYSVFAPVMDTFLKEHLFADIFERDILTYAERELVTISVLSAIGHAEPMQRSHFTICLNVGLSATQLTEFVAIIRTTLSERAAESAMLVLNEVLGINQVPTKPTDMTDPNIFPKGEKVTSPHFTGTVWLHMLVHADTIHDVNAGNVTFEPCARTNWHIHPGGQILLVTSGKGRYQEDGKPVVVIREGDVIKCDPNVKHWHGAAPDSACSHIAIGTNQGKGAVKWLEQVTDEQYGQ